MLGKSDVIDSLSRDLARARDKRDALTSGVTTLTAQIAELEARLSAENDRRERERLVSEIEAIKKQLKDTVGRFIPMITELRDATAAAAVIVPEAHELHGLLLAVAAEVDAAIPAGPASTGGVLQPRYAPSATLPHWTSPAAEK
jgi:uncharacterized phage infection (PIP) family protein YhgE